MSNSNNNWKRVGGFSRTGTQNYVRTTDAAMGGTTFGPTDISYNSGNTTLRIGNNSGVIFINGDIDMSGGATVAAPINRIRNVRDPILNQDVATKFYVDRKIDALDLANQEIGPTGPVGPPGIGFRGADGQEGTTGATGCTGAVGPPGSVIGVIGATGANGGTGATGARGAVGATGPVGAIGEKGEKGDQGIQGIQGSNGAILWLNPDGDSQTNQLITDSYLLSKVPVNTSVRTIGPISVSATYGNTNKVIPASSFFNTAEEVSTLAVIPSGVWVLNLYANVPSNSDANQISLYAAIFMISGTINQPSPNSLIIETKEGGDSGFYPPRAAYLPDHVKYIGKSWTSNDNVLYPVTDTADEGTIVNNTARKLYKIEMPVDFTTLQDASGNRTNVYVQLQIYVRNTQKTNQTANVSFYFQTDPISNQTTYSYLQTTFGAVGIQGIPGTVGPTGRQGMSGPAGPAGAAGATGAVGPTGIPGPAGPKGSQGSTGSVGPTGSANSYGVQYSVQYRGNPSTDPTNDGGNFRSDPNFRYIPGPTGGEPGYTNQRTDANAGSVVVNDIACNSIHSPVYIQDTSITGSGTTRPRTYIRGGESNSGSFVVMASGTDNTNGVNSKIPVSVNDITNGVKFIHDYDSKKVRFQIHDENKNSGTTALTFDLSGVNNIGNVSAAEDRFCIVHSSGAVGMGGISASQITSSTHTGLNRMLHVKGNIMVGSDPGGGGTAATNAMILLNRATSTPGTPLANYPGIYHRSIASGEVSTLGDSTNNMVLDASGLGIISPNFITFQTGSASKINSIVINNAGNVSVLGRTNLNRPVSVGKNFADVQTHQSLVPMMDISGTMSLSSMDNIYNDVPRIKLISNSIQQGNDIPITSTSILSTSNEIRGVIPTLDSGFLRLTAQSPGNSCIDLIGQNNSASAGRFNNSVRISTNAVSRMVVNGSGNVGIGTMDPTVTLDVAGVARVTSGSSLSTALTTTGRVGVNNASPTATLDVTGDVKVSSTLTTVGNVGVATASPTAPLDVTGNAILRNQVRIGSSVAPTTTLDVTGNARVNSGATTSTALTTTGRIGINQATPGTDLDVTGVVRVNSGATTSTALTTTGCIGINQASPGVPLDVAGAARISGNLNMSSSGRIVNLVNPQDQQDAATKSYVDTATTNMATSSSVSSAITTALGSSGAGYGDNRPTVQRGDTDGAWQYLTFINDTDFPSDGSSKRALLRCDTNLYYKPSTNALYSSEFIGNLSGTATTATSAGRSVGSQFSIGAASDSVSSLYIKNPDSTLNAGITRIRLESTNQNTESILDIGVWKEQAYFYNIKNSGIGFGTNNIQRMTVGANGNIIMGYNATTSSSYLTNNGGGDYQEKVTLVVKPLSNASQNRPYFLVGSAIFYSTLQGNAASGAILGNSNSDPYTGANSLGGLFVAFFEGPIQCDFVICGSDKRMKQNITEITDGTSSLQLLRRIKSSTFEYVDKIRHSPYRVHGFIAQDIKDIVPQAVQVVPDCLPTFYCMCSIEKYLIQENDKTETFRVYIPVNNVKKLIFTGNHDKKTGIEYKTASGAPASDASGNQNFKVKLKDSSDNDVEVITTQIIDDFSFLVKVNLNDKGENTVIKEDTYFLYGQYVDDFHKIDTEHIHNIATAALQEVDRQQQADKVRIAELEAKVAEQQSLINDILERLKRNGM